MPDNNAGAVPAPAAAPISKPTDEEDISKESSYDEDEDEGDIQDLPVVVAKPAAPKGSRRVSVSAESVNPDK